MTIEEENRKLVEACTDWVQDSEDFARIVQTFITVHGAHVLATGRGIIPSTVRRYGLKYAVPGPAVQKWIVAWIRKACDEGLGT